MKHGMTIDLQFMARKNEMLKLVVRLCIIRQSCCLVSLYLFMKYRILSENARGGMGIASYAYSNVNNMPK